MMLDMRPGPGYGKKIECEFGTNKDNIESMMINGNL